MGVHGFPLSPFFMEKIEFNHRQSNKWTGNAS